MICIKKIKLNGTFRKVNDGYIAIILFYFIMFILLYNVKYDFI